MRPGTRPLLAPEVAIERSLWNALAGLPAPGRWLRAAGRVTLVLAVLGASGCHRRAEGQPGRQAADAPSPASSSEAATPPAAWSEAAPSPAGASATTTPEFEVNAVSERSGVASWYDVPERSLAERRAWAAEMTAASDTLPPNTYVRVLRLDGKGKSVIVRITDHGIHRGNTLIDLDRPAAEALGMVKDGTARVRLEVLALKNASAAGPPTKPAAAAPRKLDISAASASDEKAAAAAKPAPQTQQ